MVSFRAVATARLYLPINPILLAVAIYEALEVIFLVSPAAAG